jgi:hypothetical protein
MLKLLKTVFQGFLVTGGFVVGGPIGLVIGIWMALVIE